MEGDCNVYAHSSLWMRPTRPDRYNAKMVYNPRNFVFTVFRWVFHLTLKLELCRHACRRRDPIISACRYGKNMPTTALILSNFGKDMTQIKKNACKKLIFRVYFHVPEKYVFRVCFVLLICVTPYQWLIHIFIICSELLYFWYPGTKFLVSIQSFWFYAGANNDALHLTCCRYFLYWLNLKPRASPPA